MNREQIQRAERFHQMHSGPEPLVLPNAWDAASARVIEAAGAEAIGTTSAGMAWSAGYPDGEQLPVRELIDACARIARVVSAPLTVDIERGFGATSRDTAVLVEALMDLGVVGINIEDGTDPATGHLADPAILAERIACIRAVASNRGLPLFVNARIDTYVGTDPAPGSRLERTRQRALSYIDAGADGIFVPGLADLKDVASLVRALPVPFNAYAGYPGAPSVAAWAEAGARRISLGCGPMQAMLAQLGRLATEALVDGRYDAMGSHMLSVSEANGLFPLRAAHAARAA